jgi:gluconolactonase
MINNPPFKPFPTFLLLCLALPGISAAGDYPEIGEVHRFEGELDRLLDSGAVIEKLTGNEFTWSEGPVWISGRNELLFSDVPENTIWKWSEESGLETFLKPSAMDDGREPNPSGQGSNGLMRSLQGGLLAADHGSRSLIEIDLATKKQTARAAEYRDKRFNSPNDLVVSRKRWPGAVFFTDPPYGLKGQEGSPLRELDFNGVYRLDADGSVTLLDDSMERPNGIALSPDEKVMYVANSEGDNTIWNAFDLAEDGSIARGPRLFASAQDFARQGKKGLPDGMAVDVEGNLWATGPGGVLVFDPSGRLLGLVETGTAIANCAFGGEKGSTLYMTSHQFIARIETRTRGLEFE